MGPPTAPGVRAAAALLERAALAALVATLALHQCAADVAAAAGAAGAPPETIAEALQSSAPNRFFTMGCWGGEKASRHRQRAVGVLMGELSQSLGVGYTIAAGDNFYRRGVNSAASPRWEDTFRSVYPADVAFYAALGNHDYKGDIWAQVNHTFLPANGMGRRGSGGAAATAALPAEGFPEGSMPAAPPHGLRWNLPYPYYTQVVGNVYWVVLDTVLLERCEVNKPKPDIFKKRCWDGYRQLGWLKRKLREKPPGVWHTLVVGHYPLYANGPHRNQEWMQRILSSLFEEHGVAAYINADNHYLQYSVHNGVYYINAGGGAGYMLHTPNQKGHQVHPDSVWQYFGDGLFVHFAFEDRILTLVAEPGQGVLHTFSIAARRGGKAGAATSHAVSPAAGQGAAGGGAAAAGAGTRVASSGGGGAGRAGAAATPPPVSGGGGARGGAAGAVRGPVPEASGVMSGLWAESVAVCMAGAILVVFAVSRRVKALFSGRLRRH